MRGESLRIGLRVAVLFEQVEGNIEPDPAGADDDDAFSDLGLAAEHVDIADDLGMLDAGNRGAAGVDAGGEHHLVEPGEFGVARGLAQPQRDAGAFHAIGVVSDAFGEFLLAGNLLGEVELAAELARLLEEGDRVAALGGNRRA